MIGLALVYYATGFTRNAETFLIVNDQFWQKTLKEFCQDPTPYTNSWFLVVEEE